MSVLQPWLLLNEMRAKMIADALGGDVWVADEHLHWRPCGSTHVAVVPYCELGEPFDAEEWSAAMRVAWARRGVRL